MTERKMWYSIVNVGMYEKQLNLAVVKSSCNMFIGWTFDAGHWFSFFVSGVSSQFRQRPFCHLHMKKHAAVMINFFPFLFFGSLYENPNL